MEQGIPMLQTLWASLVATLYIYLRPMIKWIIRRVTGKCELLRITYQYPNGAARTKYVGNVFYIDGCQCILLQYKRIVFDTFIMGVKINCQYYPSCPTACTDKWKFSRIHCINIIWTSKKCFR